MACANSAHVLFCGRVSGSGVGWGSSCCSWLVCVGIVILNPVAWANSAQVLFGGRAVGSVGLVRMIGLLAGPGCVVTGGVLSELELGCAAVRGFVVGMNL